MTVGDFSHCSDQDKLLFAKRWIEMRGDEILREHKTLSFHILKSDSVLFEGEYNNNSGNEAIQYFSLSKFVTTVLIWSAIDDGLIQDETDLVISYIPELKNNGFGPIRITDLLDMKAPVVYRDNDNPFGKHARIH